jgi:hypothetical protein
VTFHVQNFLSCRGWPPAVHPVAVTGASLAEQLHLSSTHEHFLAVQRTLLLQANTVYYRTLQERFGILQRDKQELVPMGSICILLAYMKQYATNHRLLMLRRHAYKYCGPKITRMCMERVCCVAAVNNICHSYMMIKIT